MKGRLAIMTVVVIGAVVGLYLYKRHVYEDRIADIAAVESEARAGAGGSEPAAKPDAAASDKVRKIDAERRTALLDRIRAARATRAGGGTSSSPGSTNTPPPSLPSLPGTISKDDIRAGVRAVIPLLAECYDAAQDRFSTKTGSIKVQMHLTGEPDVGTLIEKAEIEGDPQFTGDAGFVECLQQTMLSVELPPIEDGGTVDVTYPLAFAPG